MYLEEIKIKEDFRCLIKGTKITLAPITLLVGEQGCGKSSLLELIQANDVDYRMVDGKTNVETFYFDSEKMNPRIQDIDDWTTPDGRSRGIGIANGVHSRFRSHGETLRLFTVDRIKDAKDCILILDEPEAALSLTNQYKLVKEFKSAITRNVQLIVATHCLPIIESFDDIYLMEELKWGKSENYIKSIKNYVKNI